MNFRVHFIFLAGLVCATLSAQDVTGRWAGVAATTDEAKTSRQEQQSFEIKTVDGKLFAESVGRNGNPGAALQIQQDGSKINLYRFLDFEGGEHLRWKVELKNGKLVGTFSALHDNPKKWIYDRIGAITLSKAEPVAPSK
jgi:hypothetical protein